MSSSRDAVRMGEAEVAAFLAERLKVQVAVVGRDGAPHLTTLFYVLDEGRIAFWTYARSQKVVNLERDPRVSALVEDGEDYLELRGVSITGTARIVRDRGAVLDLGARVATRIAGVPTFEDLGSPGRETVERQAAKRVGVVVVPDRIASWDHRKLAGPPARAADTDT